MNSLVFDPQLLLLAAVIQALMSSEVPEDLEDILAQFAASKVNVAHDVEVAEDVIKPGLEGLEGQRGGVGLA